MRDIFHNPLHPYTEGLLKSVPVLGRKATQLLPIEGMVPSPIDKIDGCAFATRCPKAFDRCWMDDPSLHEVQPGHQVACWLHHD